MVVVSVLFSRGGEKATLAYVPRVFGRKCRLSPTAKMFRDLVNKHHGRLTIHVAPPARFSNEAEPTEYFSRISGNCG